MTLYKIANWEKFYEVSDSKKVDGPLQWVAVRTKTDGLGFLRITLQPDRTDLLAAWYLLLGLAAKQPKGERGKLSRDGVPLTPDDMELLTRFPAKLFVKALAFFSDAKQGWIESEEIRINPDASGQNPNTLGQTPPTGQDSTLQDTTVGAFGSPAKPAPTAAPKLSDQEWWLGIKASPAYVGIDVDREREKCRLWCENKRVQPTRRRLINWLNRCERPVVAGQQATKRPIPEPEGWRAWLKDQEHLEWRETAAMREWSELPRHWQEFISRGMERRNGQ